MRLLHIDTAQRRVWIANHRIHHGLAGACAFIIGAALMIHDRKDWPWNP